MAEALDLGPGGYSGSYKLVGGRPSLDLVNTISWPGTEREHDWLGTPENVLRWLAAVGIHGLPVEDVDLLEANTVRDAIAAVVRPLGHGQHPRSKDVHAFNGFVSDAFGQRRLDQQTLQWAWTTPEDTMHAFASILVDAADVVAHGDRQRLKSCPACDWVFIDQTRNGRRRWCDMADCGSRAKAHSYYHRHKA